MDAIHRRRHSLWYYCNKEGVTPFPRVKSHCLSTSCLILIMQHAPISIEQTTYCQVKLLTHHHAVFPVRLLCIPAKHCASPQETALCCVKPHTPIQSCKSLSSVRSRADHTLFHFCVLFCAMHFNVQRRSPTHPSGFGRVLVNNVQEKQRPH